MSRHRNIRSMNFNEEYDEYFNTYGQSVEEDFCISPNTEREFMYIRGERNPNMSQYFPEHREANSNDDNDAEQIDSSIRRDSINSNPQPMDHMERGQTKAKLLSCVEEMQNVVGDTIPERMLMEAAKIHNYDCVAALDSVLNAHSYSSQRESQKTQITTKTGDGTSKGTSKGKTMDYGLGSHTNVSYESSLQKPLNRTQINVTDEKEVNSKREDNTVDGKSSKNSFFLSLTAKFSKPKVNIAINKEIANQNDVTIPSMNNAVSKINDDVQRLSLNSKTELNHLNISNNTDETERNKSSSSSLAPSRDRSPCGSRTGSRISSPIHNLQNIDAKSLTKAVQSKAMNPEATLLEYNKNRGDGKPLINLIVIGHVDAGKSTLMGHLLCDLGFVTKKQMHRYETDSKKVGKASFMYAWVLDETEEERSRGITMDVAQSRFETQNRTVLLLDAPGHKDFIPNMITGAADADVAILVVDATKGEFETGFDSGGQTREHTLLVRSLGVSQLAVVINKLDNVNWSYERYNDIVQKLSVFLKHVGFKESDITFVPCSGLTGENLTEKCKNNALSSWYKGPCLVEVIDAFKPPDRPIAKPFRLRINDIFKGLTSGLCISGRVEAGAVQIGQKLVILPAGEQCVVKAIDEALSENWAFVGDYVTLTLIGCDPNNISIGNLVCDASNPSPVTNRFEARIIVYNNIDVPLTKGFPVVLHFQSLTEQAIVKKLISQMHKNGQILKNKPRCLTKNSNGVIELEVNRPIGIELYQDYKDIGRFMMRSGGATIAAGLVTKII